MMLDVLLNRFHSPAEEHRGVEGKGGLYGMHIASLPKLPRRHPIHLPKHPGHLGGGGKAAPQRHLV